LADRLSPLDELNHYQVRSRQRRALFPRIMAGGREGRLLAHRVISTACGICYQGVADIEQAISINLDLWYAP
jgi:hypothetical protein